MTNWREVKLGDICDVRDGTHDTPKESSEGKYLVTSKHIKGGKIDLSSAYKISLEDFNFVNQRSKVDKWDILISMIGTVGEICLVSEYPDFAIKNVGLIKTGNEHLARYLYYYLKSTVAQNNILSRLKGTTQQYLSLGEIRNFPIVLPPIDIQKKIAEVLGALDDKIELNNKINNNLEQQAQALILEFIQQTDQEIPLGDLITFTNGFAFKSTDYLVSGKYKIITIKNVQDGKVDSQGASQLDELPDRLPNDCCLSVGDVLLSLTGNVGRVGIVTEENLLLNQRVAKLNAKEAVFLPFLYFYMRLPSMKTEMENISKGTAQQNLSPVETLKLKIPFEKEKILSLSKTLSSFFDQIVYNFIQNRKLSALRDTLLPKLMKGEIDVSNVDISDLTSTDKLSFSEAQQ